jgi:SAM-dependent methyltransferase
MELLLGAGASRKKKMWLGDQREWTGLSTLDFNNDHNPDICFDLRYNSNWKYLVDDYWSEVHAYDVMEHLGQQGDYETFFFQWSEIWRILRPGGHFFGISPSIYSPWLWGDPGHTRAISRECLYFLHQPAYDEVGTTPMTDYRFCYRADFDFVRMDVSEETGQFYYILKAVKPSRVKT